MMDFPSSFVSSSEFGDFDCFVEAARDWDLDFHQLDRGGFGAWLNQLVTPRIRATECHVLRRVHQEGSPPPGFRTFGFASGDHLDLIWRGKTIDENCLLIFPPGAPLDSVSEPGFEIIVISIADSLLEEYAACRGVDSVETLFPESDVLRLAPDVRRHLAGLARGFIASGLNEPWRIFDWGFRENLSNSLCGGVLEVLDRAREGRVSNGLAINRRRAVDQAVEVIQSRASEPVQITEVESVVGVSPRTLRYAFREHFGMSPKQYLQCYRLSRVHRELRQGASVSDAASRWGFWHMGQFATDFRRQFGGLPSEVRQGGVPLS